MSKSQIKQDLNVIKFYNNKKNGFFIEIGANDGIKISNTYLLEKKYNWKGICCEANPLQFKKLLVNRPTAICFSEAVYNKSGLTVRFDIANNNNLLSGISEYIIKHKNKVENNKRQIQVKTLSLLDILDKANSPPFIEYMSIDTEGSEYEILKNFNFQKYTFGLIDVEHAYDNIKRTNIKKLLLSNGYLYKGNNNQDDMYMHNSVKNNFFSKNINIYNNKNMEKTIIIQSSPPHTGSTVLVNILYGLLHYNKPVTYINFDKRSGYAIINNLLKNDNVCIIKTHICNIDRLKAHLKNYRLFFICSERGNNVINSKFDTYNNVLKIKYNELLETPTYTVDNIVSVIQNKLLTFLPNDFILNKELAVDRINNMNTQYELIKDKPFNYVDKFYHLHGSHRNRK
jgi:FkbM family methyltransferase